MKNPNSPLCKVRYPEPSGSTLYFNRPPTFETKGAINPPENHCNCDLTFLLYQALKQKVQSGRVYPCTSPLSKSTIRKEYMLVVLARNKSPLFREHCKRRQQERTHIRKQCAFFPFWPPNMFQRFLTGRPSQTRCRNTCMPKTIGRLLDP